MTITLFAKSLGEKISSGFNSIPAAVCCMVMYLACGSSGPTKTEEIKPQTLAELDADRRYSDCISELKGASWVKDVSTSAGYLNIGVIRNQKDWSSPMTARYAKAILKKHNVQVSFIRFVDIEQVVYRHKSPRDAEICSFPFDAL